MIPGVILGVPDEFSQNEDQSDSKCSINLEESGYSPLECSDFLFKKRLSTSARWISVGSLKCQNIYRSVLQQDTFILSICNFKKFKNESFSFFVVVGFRASDNCVAKCHKNGHKTIPMGLNFEQLTVDCNTIDQWHTFCTSAQRPLTLASKQWRLIFVVNFFVTNLTVYLTQFNGQLN